MLTFSTPLAVLSLSLPQVLADILRPLYASQHPQSLDQLHERLGAAATAGLSHTLEDAWKQWQEVCSSSSSSMEPSALLDQLQVQAGTLVAATRGFLERGSFADAADRLDFMVQLLLPVVRQLQAPAAALCEQLEQREQLGPGGGGSAATGQVQSWAEAVVCSLEGVACLERLLPCLAPVAAPQLVDATLAANAAADASHERALVWALQLMLTQPITKAWSNISATCEGIVQRCSSGQVPVHVFKQLSVLLHTAAASWCAALQLPQQLLQERAPSHATHDRVVEVVDQLAVLAAVEAGLQELVELQGSAVTILAEASKRSPHGMGAQATAGVVSQLQQLVGQLQRLSKGEDVVCMSSFLEQGVAGAHAGLLSSLLAAAREACSHPGAATDMGLPAEVVRAAVMAAGTALNNGVYVREAVGLLTLVVALFSNLPIAQLTLLGDVRVVSTQQLCSMGLTLGPPGGVELVALVDCKCGGCAACPVVLLVQNHGDVAVDAGSAGCSTGSSMGTRKVVVDIMHCKELTASPGAGFEATWSALQAWKGGVEQAGAQECAQVELRPCLVTAPLGDDCDEPPVACQAAAVCNQLSHSLFMLALSGGAPGGHTVGALRLAQQVPHQVGAVLAQLPQGKGLSGPVVAGGLGVVQLAAGYLNQQAALLGAVAAAADAADRMPHSFAIHYSGTALQAVQQLPWSPAQMQQLLDEVAGACDSLQGSLVPDDLAGTDQLLRLIQQLSEGHTGHYQLGRLQQWLSRQQAGLPLYEGLVDLANKLLRLIRHCNTWAEQSVGGAQGAAPGLDAWCGTAPQLASLFHTLAEDLLGSSFKVDASSITKLRQHTPQQLQQWDHQLYKLLQQVGLPEAQVASYQGFFASFHDLLTSPATAPSTAAAEDEESAVERVDSRSLRLQRRQEQLQQVAAALQQLLERAQGMTPPPNLLVSLLACCMIRRVWCDAGNL